MLKKVALVVVVLLVVLLAAILSRPPTFHVERSITLAAPAEIPFALVNDFHRWHFWSPWEQLDPKMKRGFDGPYAGPGAIYSWTSDKAGSGVMTLQDARPYDSIHIQLEFLAPMRASNDVTFTFQPVPEGITVRWAMDGQNTFVGKALTLFGGMDSFLGKDFERGLARLKEVSETEAKNRRERDALIKARDEAQRTATPTPPAPTP